MSTKQTITKIAQELENLPKRSQLHVYYPEDVLRPRGHMKKESIGQYILDRLEGAYESWTDERYDDNPHELSLLVQLHKNLMEEADGAWKQFTEKLKSKNSV